MTFKVDDCDNGERFFEWEEDAEEYAEKRREALHQKYCIEKEVPDKGECICTRPDLPWYRDGIECAPHHYARTVKAHHLEDCKIVDNCVTVEQVEIN
jgi:hypothetical protein